MVNHIIDICELKFFPSDAKILQDQFADKMTLQFTKYSSKYDLGVHYIGPRAAKPG